MEPSRGAEGLLSLEASGPPGDSRCFLLSSPIVGCQNAFAMVPITPGRRLVRLGREWRLRGLCDQ